MRVLKATRRALERQVWESFSIEQEERELAHSGGVPLPRPDREEVTSIPKCTSESAGYCIECWPCRRKGLKYIYIGGTSQSSYQRGREHQQEGDLVKESHHLVSHLLEVHKGQQQQILMSVKTKHIRPLEGEVRESVVIH